MHSGFEWQYSSSGGLTFINSHSDFGDDLMILDGTYDITYCSLCKPLCTLVSLLHNQLQNRSLSLKSHASVTDIQRKTQIR